MTTKKSTMIFFLPIFPKIQSQTCFEKALDPFFEKYQHLYKTLLTQSLPAVEFYHWLKYLRNFQSHPVFVRDELILFYQQHVIIFFLLIVLSQQFFESINFQYEIKQK
jgi:hypothetical protein